MSFYYNWTTAEDLENAAAHRDLAQARFEGAHARYQRQKSNEALADLAVEHPGAFFGGFLAIVLFILTLGLISK